MGTLGAGAGMVADSATDSAIVFGGESSQGLSNATISYSESTNSWTVVPATNAPSPRSDFAFGLDPSTGDAVLFGGLLNLTSESVSSATWVYSIATEAWTNVSQAGPGPREDPAFAIDPALGIGLLYGGENQNYESVGSLTYSDLWEFNLSTFVWTRINVTSGPRPPPLEGAALTWDPSSGEFQMFGGCAPCSSTVWEFDPVSEEWSEFAAPSNAPTPTSGSSWTYDPSLNADLLFGGTDGTTADNETAIFYPGNNTWIPLELPSPGPRWSAASAYLNVSGNATWLVAGGSTSAGPTSDLWRLSATSDLTLRVENASTPNLPIAGAVVSLNDQALGSTDAEGELNLTQINGVDSQLRVEAYGYFANTSTLWLPPGSSTPGVVLLTVIPAQDLGTVRVTVDAVGGAPIVGADVNLTVDGFHAPSPADTTGTTGMVNFTRVPAGTLNVSASAAGWRANSTDGNLPEAATVGVTVELNADPTLSVTVSGQLPSGSSAPLGGVTVSLNGVPFGVTDASGSLSLLTAAFGLSTVTGAATGYSSGTTTVAVPWTGTVNATLVLVSLSAGGMDVLVLDASTNQSLEGARVSANSVGPLPSGWSNATFDTDASGWANDSNLLEGYYEVTADDMGYVASAAELEHVVSSQNITVTIRLVPGATIALHVQSKTDRMPIPGARVTLSGYASGETDIFGYFNLTDVPAGRYAVVVSATGYLTNTTSLTFSALENATIPILLTPTGPGQTQGSSFFSLLPAGSIWELLLLVPAVLALGGILYATATRSAPEDDVGGGVPAEERPVPRPPPPNNLH